MATARLYTMEQIEAARKKLRSLPVKTVGKTRAEVVEFLGNDIKKAIRQGYTLRDIRDLLADAGVSVPLTKLEALLGKAPALGPVTGKEETDQDTALPVGGGETGEHGSTVGVCPKKKRHGQGSCLGRAATESLEQGGGRV